jgi:hypothetical protein
MIADPPADLTVRILDRLPRLGNVKYKHPFAARPALVDGRCHVDPFEDSVPEPLGVEFGAEHPAGIRDAEHQCTATGRVRQARHLAGEVFDRLGVAPLARQQPTVPVASPRLFLQVDGLGSRPLGEPPRIQRPEDDVNASPEPGPGIDKISMYLEKRHPTTSRYVEYSLPASINKYWIGGTAVGRAADDHGVPCVSDPP